MQREAFSRILGWSKGENRLPLVLRGARQVGKSYLVRWLGKNHFNQFIEINLEKNPELSELFDSNNVEKIIEAIEVHSNMSVQPGKTLLFIDEIQAYPKILSSLRWFAEDCPELHVIVAGSLLDFALADFEYSMPVGRIEFMYIEPFSFFEFLDALEEKKLLQVLESVNSSEELSQAIHRRAMELFKRYVLVGGMPKSIKVYRETKKMEMVSRVHQGIIESFRSDFSKFKKRIPPDRIRKVYDSIFQQVGKKFVYARVDSEEKNAAIKSALELLLLARVGYKVESSHCNGIPLGAESNEKNFKIFSLDIGLISSALGLTFPNLKDDEDVMLVNAGALAEQFVSQMLRYKESQVKNPKLFYWVREKSGSEAEVDFVAQVGLKIIPIEVKSGKSGTLKSLRVMASEKKLLTAVRFNSALPLESEITADGWTFKLISLPIYLAERFQSLLE